MSSSLQAAYGLSSSWSRHRAHTYIILSTLSCREIEAGEHVSRIPDRERSCYHLELSHRRIISVKSYIFLRFLN